MVDAVDAVEYCEMLRLVSLAGRSQSRDSNIVGQIPAVCPVAVLGF